MPRIESIAKGGYYPYPAEHLAATVSLFKSTPAGGLMLDPCAGEGAALDHLARALHLTPYANELDLDRAHACETHFGLDHVVQGDLMTLRTPHNAYALVWVNPPYAANFDGADEKRRELEFLRHAWQWAMPGGLVCWIVYHHHLTERAARLLLENTTQLDVWRLPGLHLGQYHQILVVARKTERHESSDSAILRLAEQCRQPDQLPPLALQSEPRYRLPEPRPLRSFYFHADKIPAATLLAALERHGVQHTPAFHSLFDLPARAPLLTPIVPPRGGQIGLILAAGLFDGLLLDIEGAQAAVRGVARMVEVNTTEPGMEGIRETFELRPQVTVTLLHPSGQTKVIEGSDQSTLIDFIKTHRDAFLTHVDQRSRPLYTFDYSHLTPTFDRVFRNRRLPGRPTTGLFETQKHIVAAIHATLQQRQGVIVVGEMGTGKSAMGAATIAAFHRGGQIKPGQIAVVMCPPHLTAKWEREIQDAIPGCTVHTVTTVDDTTAFLRTAALRPDTLHILILSRERAKLGEGWQPAYQIRQDYVVGWAYNTARPDHLHPDTPRITTRAILICPGCGQDITRRDKTFASDSWLKQQPRRCTSPIIARDGTPRPCNTPLWQLRRTFSTPRPGHKFPARNPRYPLAELLRRRYAGRIAIAVIDELHETKSEGSDQGRAMQHLVKAARKAIGLTGTLFGGTASSVFWLEWAFNPRMAHQYPISASRTDAVRRWVQAMGVLERVVEYQEDQAGSGRYTTTRRVDHAPREIPGISPRLVGELLDHCLWVSLSDLNFALPPYGDTPVELDLPPDIQHAYDAAQKQMLEYMTLLRNEGADATFLSTYLQAMLRYPSSCFRAKSVVHRTQLLNDQTGERIEQLVTVIPGFDGKQIYPKEQWLIDTVNDEISHKRGCAVFVSQTGTLDIQPRLEALLQQHVAGARPFILRADTVATDQRDGYVQKQTTAGFNVLICNPRLVQTGLDLLAFPTLIFYEVDYSLYVSSQAARRAWRIGQTAECRTFYPYYAGTMEAQAIELISQKQAAAALLGGDADGGGLAQLAGHRGSASLMAELAKTIASDEQVVDVTQLFRQKAQQSLDFTSGWATGSPVDEATATVVPLANLVGKRFTYQAEAHQVVDYGPLNEASYRVKNLFTGAEALLPAEIVERTPALSADSPVTLHNRKAPSMKTTANTPTSTTTLTPLRQQYLQVKQQFPQAILLFSLGDFYEAFDSDAEIVARELDIVLTSRSVSKTQRVPMAGIPRRAAETTISRLIAKGYHVAVCEPTGEQAEDGLTPRQVVRVVKPDAETPPAPALPDVPLLADYRTAKLAHPAALALIERGDFFYAYGADARQVAHALNAVLDASLIEGVRVEQTAIPAKHLDFCAQRLRKAGFKLTVVPHRNPQTAAQPVQNNGEHTLPAEPALTLLDAFQQYRGGARLIPMDGHYLIFGPDANQLASKHGEPLTRQVLDGQWIPYVRLTPQAAQRITQPSPSPAAAPPPAALPPGPTGQLTLFSA